MKLQDALEAIVEGRPMTRASARSVMDQMIHPDASPIQTAGLLAALRVRGAEPAELAGFVDALRARQVEINFGHADLVDSCGTGGGRSTINLSTGAAFLAAAAGARVAKHGNRSVTSRCGSADVLEALGVSLSGSPEFVQACMMKFGLAFLFAPEFHPALKQIGPLRRELGIRTVFNQLGPLLNPAIAAHQVIGVYSSRLLRPMAEALVLLGAKRAFVVHSRDGLDEFSPSAPTDVAEVFEGEVRTFEVEPATFGFKGVDPEVLSQPDTPKESAQLLDRAFRSPDSPEFRCFVPNAAACLVVSGVAKDWKTASEMVMEAGNDGRVVKTLEGIIELSRQS